MSDCKGGDAGCGSGWGVGVADASVRVVPLRFRDCSWKAKGVRRDFSGRLGPERILWVVLRDMMLLLCYGTEVV